MRGRRDAGGVTQGIWRGREVATKLHELRRQKDRLASVCNYLLNELMRHKAGRPSTLVSGGDPEITRDPNRSVIEGVLGTAAALAVAWSDVKFLFDLFSRLLGFFGGALAGVFVLAVARPRTSPIGAGAGLVAGAASAALASFLLVDAEPRVLDGYLLGAIGLGVAVVLGALAPTRRGSDAGS